MAGMGLRLEKLGALPIESFARQCRAFSALFSGHAPVSRSAGAYALSALRASPQRFQHGARLTSAQALPWALNGRQAFR